MHDDGDGIYDNAQLHVSAEHAGHSMTPGTDTILFYGPDAVGG